VNGADRTRALHGQMRRRPGKYRAVRTNGYASKLEARCAERLGIRRDAINGDIAYFLEQVPIRFSSGVKYVCDFLVFMRDGSHRYIEAKGVETAAWKIKLRLLKDEFPQIAERLEVWRR
jgi:Protein of unknown function (DUF1064)